MLKKRCCLLQLLGYLESLTFPHKGGDARPSGLLHARAVSEDCLIDWCRSEVTGLLRVLGGAVAEGAAWLRLVVVWACGQARHAAGGGPPWRARDGG